MPGGQRLVVDDVSIGVNVPTGQRATGSLNTLDSTNAILALRHVETPYGIMGPVNVPVSDLLRGGEMVRVADAYLLGLALKHDGVLTTLDERIVALTLPNTAGRKALTIVS